MSPRGAPHPAYCRCRGAEAALFLNKISVASLSLFSTEAN